MYQLFEQLSTNNNGVIRPPGLELVKRTYQASIDNIINYYQTRTFFTSSNHLLVRLLDVAGVPHDYSLDRFVEASFARSPYIAKYFNFTSEINYGKHFDGVFYGEGSTEFILYVEDYFDPYKAIENWKQIRAVNVLSHSISDTNFILPNGRKNSTDVGMATLAINIPLLLLQYRCFIREQILKIETDEGHLDSRHFLMRYVLPNMLYSHVDQVIVNRAINLYYGAPMGAGLSKYPFPIIDYTDKLDRNLKDIIKRVSKRRIFYTTMLKVIPSIFSEDSQYSLLMPNIAKTRQVWWCLLLTRLRIIKFLIHCGGKEAITSNRSYINKLQIHLKRLLDDNVIQTMLNEDMYYDTISTINELLDL